MDWFSGSITGAIGEAKTRGALFVVAVHGPVDDEATASFLSLLDVESISGRLRESRAVCIQVLNGSTAAAQFSQIYPVVLVPSIYFINSSTGVDLEVTGGAGLTEAKLLDSIDKAAKALGQQKSQASAADAALSPRGARVEEAQKVLQGSTATEAAASDGSSSSSTESKTAEQLTLEERVARAKELLAARRAQKEGEEGESSKSSEVKRRELGKQMAELKRHQEDELIRQAAEERRRDKEEEKVAREKVKAQIEQDRTERAERFNKEKEERQQKGREQERVRLVEASKQAEEEVRNRSSIARIQFRLPDGRSQTKQFSPSDTLAQLYSYVGTEMSVGFSRFSLSTTFPSRQLDQEDRSLTLRQLELVPSATVLILPSSSSTSGSQTNGLFAILWAVLSPLTALWAFVSSFLFPQQQQQQGRLPAAGPSSSNARAGPSGQAGRGTGAIRKEGNIARLRNTDDDDDENNTYNGNSTQQM